MTKKFNGVMALALMLSLLGTLTASAQSVTLYQGAQLTGRLRTTLDSGSAQVGDRFVMDVVQPYPSGNPDFQGATIVGHVASVQSAGQGTKPQMRLKFDYLRMRNGATADIVASVSSEQKKQQAINPGRTALTAIGGMLVGNAIGKTIFHTGGGGAVGLIGGALYGANQKQNFQLPAGSNMTITLNQTMTVRRQAH